MTSTHNSAGRLGNQIIRNLAVSLIAKKHNLSVDYSYYKVITDLGINLFIGQYNHNNTIDLTDDNFLSILSKESMKSNLNANYNFFQTKAISKLIYDYICEDNQKQNIIKKNPFNALYNNNNDLFIHIRLMDAEIYNPGINYYLTAIAKVIFTNLYISTDNKNHLIIQELIKNYPSTQIIEYDEIKTFQFSSTCKNIILSHGSFSALIGFLSFFSTIYYPAYDENKRWCGDMFSIDGWNKI